MNRQVPLGCLPILLSDPLRRQSIAEEGSSQGNGYQYRQGGTQTQSIAARSHEESGQDQGKDEFEGHEREAGDADAHGHGPLPGACSLTEACQMSEGVRCAGAIGFNRCQR